MGALLVLPTSMDSFLFSWQRAWTGIGAAGEGAALFARLMAAYAEPQRHYHTQQHLGECLSAFDGACAGRDWRGDSIGPELRAALRADPVGRPGRRQCGFDLDLPEARLIERDAHHRLDRERRWAAGIGRRQQHARGRHVANDAEIDDRKRRYFGIGDLLQDGADATRHRARRERSRGAPVMSPCQRPSTTLGTSGGVCVWRYHVASG